MPAVADVAAAGQIVCLVVAVVTVAAGIAASIAEVRAASVTAVEVARDMTVRQVGQMFETLEKRAVEVGTLVQLVDLTPVEAGPTAVARHSGR